MAKLCKSERKSPDFQQTLPKEELSSSIDPRLLPFIDSAHDVDVLSEVVESAINLMKGFIFIFYAVDLENRRLPLFVRVCGIFNQNNENIILGALMKTITFDENGHYYIVEKDNEQSQIVRIEPHSLPFFKKLILQSHNDHLVIQKEFHFGYENSHNGILSNPFLQKR